MAPVTVLGASLFWASLMLSWMNSATHVLHPEKQVYDRWARLLGQRWANRRFVPLAILTAVFASLAAAFCTGVWPLTTGWVLLAMMAGIRQWEIGQWNYDIVVGLGKYVPTAGALLGYVATAGLVGWLWPAMDADARGWDAACGVLAGCWGLAAIAKFRESGMHWVSSENVALLVYERTYHGPRGLNRFRRAAARSPLICYAAANVGMWGEAAGVAFLFPAARWPVAIALFFFQLTILLLLGYVELEWMLVMLACAALSHGSPGLFG